MAQRNTNFRKNKEKFKRPLGRDFKELIRKGLQLGPHSRGTNGTLGSKKTRPRRWSGNRGGEFVEGGEDSLVRNAQKKTKKKVMVMCLSNLALEGRHGRVEEE